ncbi:MAG: hypothetical protein LAP61_21195 [Acidobacteriia bacterium]|nr:hypothetical protein [Terriglobia bacterium]
MKMMLKVLLAAGVTSMLLAQTDDVLRAQKKAAAEAAADQVKANVMFNKQTFAFVSSQLVSGPTVKGAPYSAEVVNETIQTLADGNRIVQRSSAMQYRDSEGRERREETSAMGAIFITDPVAGTRFTLHPESRTAEKGAVPVMFSTASVPGVPGDRGGPDTVSVAIAGTAAAPQGFFYVNSGSITKFSSPSDSKTEDLGKMYIEGVQAQGTRTTTTIPAGDIGNDRPINIVDERWYSPDLQMTVMTRHSDPRTGETTFALKSINRSSPPPTFFEVPSDYTVTAGGGRGGRSGGPVLQAVPATPGVLAQPRK